MEQEEVCEPSPLTEELWTLPKLLGESVFFKGVALVGQPCPMDESIDMRIWTAQTELVSFKNKTVKLGGVCRH